jgi:endonuclease-3
VLRVTRRLDLTKNTEPVKVEQDLLKIIPKERWILFSHQIIHHGRALCVARKPRCTECKMDPICYASDKTNHAS